MIFESLTSNLAIIFITFFALIYIYFTWNFDYWSKKGVPHLKPVPFVGNFGKVVTVKTDMAGLFEGFYKSKKQHPFFGIWIFRKPAIVLNSPDLIKSIMVKDFDHFSDRTTFADRSYDPLGAGSLFFGKNPIWKHMRVKLTPLFSSSKMKTMFELINEIGLELVNCIKGYNGDAVEVKDTMGRFTTDVIASTAFGLKAHSLNDPDSMFNTFRKKLITFGFFRSIQFMAIFFYQEVAKLLGSTVFENESQDWLRNVFWKTVEERERTKEHRNDLIGTLISLKNQTENDETLSFTGDTLVAQVASFFFAGNETSSSAMAFTLYELATNLDIQEKLSLEISSILAKYDNKITYEAIQEMTYLDMCFKETLRLHPSLPFLDRECTKPYKIPGTNITLPKGMMVYIPVIGLHLDPEHHENPLKYKPERFDKITGNGVKPFTYLSFGEGPRNCIGERYGTLQSKIGLVHLLNNFSVRTCSKTQIPLIFQKIVIPPTVQGGIHLKFVPK